MAVHDPAKRRQGKRKGRERGAWIYVTAEELSAMGFDVSPTSSAPFYRTWRRSKTLLVQFYAEA